MTYVAPQATVDDGAVIGSGTKVWDHAVVRAGATVGQECIVGRHAFVDHGVTVGDRCKIQNNALLYSPAVIEDGVFIGPAAVLTNDRYPRAVTPTGEPKGTDDWKSSGVHVERGASIGAGSTVIGGVRIGAWALVAAGSTVTRDVAPYALVAGSPARRIAWVGPAGHPLEERDGAWKCPRTGQWFDQVGDTLEPR